jgi:CubicO group peptidase (beta-lactamase class C family)
MIYKIKLRFASALVVLVSIFSASSLLPGVAAQAEVKQTLSTDLQKAVAAIEEKTEARRKELGIPGMSLAIVKDGEVIFMKGFGYKDFERKIPVTAETQFAIGSSSKAFTALSVLMSQDEGRLSLDDSPKKYLSFFKINDPEIDKNITVRDLMAHSSGLNRTDLGWITGKLTREEIIRVAGEAKPMAKLREKFFYQNVMFVAAGEIVSRVQKMPWERFVPERVFKPLGMTNSTMSLKEMQKKADYSFGYDYNFDTKETRKLPLRDIDEVAPAGSINSSARDMTQWLKFVLNRGEINGKRLVSEKGFDEWTKLQMKITPNGKVGYGLGWFIRDWNGMKVVEHGGNIDGFNALVAMIPEKKLGFVMLTNVSGSSLGSDLMPIIWENVLSNPNQLKTAPVAAGDLEKEVGKYRFEAAGFDVDIQMQNGKLVAVVPGQPLYTLENVGARRYRLNGAPEGFYVTFKDGEAYLEQPQGNYTLPRLKANGTIEVKNPAAAKELIGRYESETVKGSIHEVSEADGKVTLNINGQPPYELKEKEKDTFSLSPLPDAYYLKAKRDANGKISGFAIVQPEGEFAFIAVAADNKPNTVTITVDELMAKTIDALGGEANWRKLNSRVTKFDIDFENQGVKGMGTTFEKAPNMTKTEVSLTALGKPIAEIREYFDGAAGGDWASFSPPGIYTGQRLEDVKYGSDFYGLVNWKTGLKKAEIRGTEKVGNEDAYIVRIQPEKASEVTYFISTKTFLPLKKTSIIVSSTSAQKTPVSEHFSDYRTIDGIMIPFKTTSMNPDMGAIVAYIKEVKHNITVDNAVFKPKDKKMTATK